MHKNIKYIFNSDVYAPLILSLIMFVFFIDGILDYELILAPPGGASMPVTISIVSDRLLFISIMVMFFIVFIVSFAIFLRQLYLNIKGEE